MGFSGLGGGCAARHDFLKLQQEVKYEKQQRVQRHEAMQKHTDERREQLQRDQAALRAQLDRLRKEFTASQAGLATKTRQSLEDTDTALRAELSDVRTLAAELRVALANVREVEIGRVIGKTEENQQGIEDLSLQLDKVVGELHGGDATLQQVLREEHDHVRSVLADHAMDIGALQIALRNVEEVVAAESKTLDEFGQTLGRRISELEQHRERVETRTSMLIEKHAADMATVRASLNEQRDSLTGFEEVLARLGGDLAAQVIEQVSQQDKRIQALSAQVQQIQGWVETRTEELAEQDATDMTIMVHRFDELRKSLASFETALSNIGEQFSAQIVEEGSLRDDRVKTLSAQVRQMQSWVETRARVLEEKQIMDAEATAAQLEKLRGSLAGFEDAIVRLGKGVAVQMSEQEARQEPLAAQMRVAQLGVLDEVEVRIAELANNQKRFEKAIEERKKQGTKNAAEMANQDKWIQSVATRLGQVRASQFELEKQVVEVLEAVDKMEARGVETMRQVNGLTQFIDQLKARGEREAPRRE